METDKETYNNISYAFQQRKVFHKKLNATFINWESRPPTF